MNPVETLWILVHVNKSWFATFVNLYQPDLHGQFYLLDELGPIK